jgi:hypothetical protein
MIEEINKIRNEKNYPVPELYPDIYIDYNICPICYKDASTNSMTHPNDINKKIRIHVKCWYFIRSHWKCRKCKKYFSKSEMSIRVCELGTMCKECFEKYNKRKK